MPSVLPVNPNAVAGYVFDSAPDLARARDRERLSPSAIIASSTYHAWRSNPQGRKLDQDTLMRISLLIGIYKALNIHFGKPWADRWVTLANRGALFAGQSPLDYMLRQGQPGMMQVRRMIGWPIFAAPSIT